MASLAGVCIDCSDDPAGRSLILIGGHTEPVIEFSTAFLFFVQSMALLGIELLANTIRDISVGLENPTLLYIFNEGLEMVCLHPMVSFSLWILPAVLSFVATRRPGISYNTIHIAPDGILAGYLFGVNLSVSISKYLSSHR
jgi:hypothetical protein